MIAVRARHDGDLETLGPTSVVFERARMDLRLGDTGPPIAALSPEGI